MKKIPGAGNPRFEHDCNHCIFLGSFCEEGYNDDLYFCTQGGSLPTLIARHSSDDPDYTSGWNLGQMAAEKKVVRYWGEQKSRIYINPPMRTAFIRAVEAKLARPDTVSIFFPIILPVPSNLENI